jgi:hypothetical protein
VREREEALMLELEAERGAGESLKGLERAKAALEKNLEEVKKIIRSLNRQP